jgi:ankyrin repeat protein
MGACAALLQRGATVNSRTADGSTPLHLACKKDHALVVKVLIAKGADIMLRDEDGFSAMDLAGLAVWELFPKSLEAIKDLAAKDPNLATEAAAAYAAGTASVAVGTASVVVGTASSGPSSSGSAVPSASKSAR